MRLLTIMERHIRDGLHLQLQCSADQVSLFYHSCQTGLLLKSITTNTCTGLIHLLDYFVRLCSIDLILDL